MNRIEASRITVVVLLLLAMAFAVPGGAAAQANLPPMVVIATYPVGGAYHVVGSALAALISDHTPVRGIVQPMGGPNAFIPAVSRNEVQFGITQALDLGWALTGGPGYPTPYKNLRLALLGTELQHIGMVVRRDSDIYRVEDLRGKAVASDYGANVVLQRFVEITLRLGGLTWDDVRQVPTPDGFAGLRLLRDGIIDGADGAGPTTPDVMEIDQAVGLRIIPPGDLTPADIQDGVPEDVQALLDELAPGVTLGVVPEGIGVLKEDTVLFTYPLVLLTSDEVSDDVVYTLLKAVWENAEDLDGVHPWVNGWHPEDTLVTTPPAPWHDGAVRFFKEIGVWTEEHEQGQQAALQRIQ